MNQFLFLDTNYLEFSTLTGSFNTSTVEYCRDSRSDIGFCLFAASVGSMTVDLLTTLTTDTYMVLNNNFTSGEILYSQDDVTYTTLTTFATSSFYFHSTITARYWKLGATAGTVGAFGEFIVTKRKFQLNTNPSHDKFKPGIAPVGQVIEYWDSRTRRIDTDIDGNFNCNIGWNYLLGNVDSMTGTDLQNVTELVRRKTTFLFHIHGGSATAGNFPDMYCWRKDDIFKCRIDTAVSYGLPVPGKVDIITADYVMKEAS